MRKAQLISAMKFDDLIENITPEIYANLKRSIELGKWPDGRLLNQEQKELSMQAVIAYEAKHIDEKDRIGYIEAKKCASETDDMQMAPTPINWVSSDDEPTPET